jgi:hypothetical protein
MHHHKYHPQNVCEYFSCHLSLRIHFSKYFVISLSVFQYNSEIMALPKKLVQGNFACAMQSYSSDPSASCAYPL